MIYAFKWEKKKSKKGHDILVMKFDTDDEMVLEVTDYASDAGYNISVAQAIAKPIVVTIKDIDLEHALDIIQKFKKA